MTDRHHFSLICSAEQSDGNASGGREFVRCSASSQLDFLIPARFIRERKVAGLSHTRFSQWKQCFFQEVRVRDTGVVYGSRCTFCYSIWKDRQRSSFVLMKDLRNCKEAIPEARRCVEVDAVEPVYRYQDSSGGSMDRGGLRGGQSMSQGERMEGSVDAFGKPRLKRRQTSITDRKHCSEADADEITSPRLEAFVDQGWAFTAFESSGKI